MPDFSLTHRVVSPRGGAPPHPALLLLHGRGADEHDLVSLAGALDPALLVLSLRAPFQFPYGGYAWYAMDTSAAPDDPAAAGYPDRQTLDTSLDSLDRFLREAIEAYPIDPARIYALGFSQGAVMAGTLALTRPRWIAGAALLSGYLPLHAGLDFHLEAASGHPVFEAHGTLDPVIPVSLGRQTARFLESTPVNLTYREYVMGHEIVPGELQDAQSWFAAVLQPVERDAEPA